MAPEALMKSVPTSWIRSGMRVEPDPAEMGERYGPEMTVPDWHSRLVCSRCGSRRVDMVVTGTELR